MGGYSSVPLHSLFSAACFFNLGGGGGGVGGEGRCRPEGERRPGGAGGGGGVRPCWPEGEEPGGLWPTIPGVSLRQAILGQGVGRGIEERAWWEEVEENGGRGRGSRRLWNTRGRFVWRSVGGSCEGMGMVGAGSRERGGGGGWGGECRERREIYLFVLKGRQENNVTRGLGKGRRIEFSGAAAVCRVRCDDG